MRFTDALKIIHENTGRKLPEFRVLLACGFTPLHLQTFLAAHLQQHLPERLVTVTPGVYGDCIGTLSRPDLDDFQACAIVLEWADLDPRLGFRSLGGWGPGKLDDMVAGVQAQLRRLQEYLERAPAHLPIAISTPTLRMAPVFYQTGSEAGEMELEISLAISSFAAWAAKRRNLHVLSQDRVDQASPAAARFDLKAEVVTGLSYTQAHADAVAESLARLLHPPAPKKGLITDLDGTLWAGILGDVGVEGISWDLNGHSQLHGLYQQLLHSLAAEGVLIAVASRNDPESVRQAFARADMLLPDEDVFPVEVHWNVKSGSVTRILQTWNISADSVVMIDDSRMELAEVKTVHPEIKDVFFPDDYSQGLQMLYDLRDLFGRSRLSAEDANRRESIRAAAAFRPSGNGGSSTSEELLKQADAQITFDFVSAAGDPRCFELVNKTNQFNLNGRRFSEAEWHRMTTGKGRFVVSATYQDKFGPLGKIAVVCGENGGSTVSIDTWVMSCRSFARRVEHQCISAIFERFGANQLQFDFLATPRNGPLQQFFAGLLGAPPTSRFTISRQDFGQRCPALYHAVTFLEPRRTQWEESPTSA